MNIGDARVSTGEQTLDLQLNALANDGCERVFTETASGTPSAVLVDADGKIASDVAVGAPAVLALAGAGQGETPSRDG